MAAGSVAGAGCRFFFIGLDDERSTVPAILAAVNLADISPDDLVYLLASTDRTA